MEFLKLDLTASLKGLESWVGSATGKWRARNFLVGSQVAMSLVLLVGAGLFVRAQYTLFTSDLGFEIRQVLLVPLNVAVPPYTEDSAWSFYHRDPITYIAVSLLLIFIALAAMLRPAFRGAASDAAQALRHD